MEKQSTHIAGFIKWKLWNYECDNCEIGIVQIHRQVSKRGITTDEVSGCMNCKKEFGIRQASNLKPLVI